MTGGELAAAAIAGKIVTHASKEMAEESKSIRKELLEQAKETPEFNMAARSYAKRVAIRQELLTSMYKPIAKMFGVANHYFESDFQNDMAEKLAEVPEELLVAPKASLAAPAMQQLGFSLDEPDLKEMYLNLLATASDSRKADSAHPSFVEIIKQLSANELPFLNRVITQEGKYTAIVQLKIYTDGEEGFNILVQHLMENIDKENNSQASRDHLPTYVVNWLRLGLVDLSYVSFITTPNAYDWVESSMEMQLCINGPASHEGKRMDFDKGVISPTAFGLSFAGVVGITS